MSATKAEAPQNRHEVGGRIVPCNFRSAGRLSNDTVRHLRTMHDTFARNLAHSLDLFLGSPIELKMAAVQQVSSRELSGMLSSGEHLVPLTLMPGGQRVLVSIEQALLFPLLDVLLGGSGEQVEALRELTDIDEELIRSVMEVMASQLERVWRSCGTSVLPTASLRPAVAQQMFAAEDRVIALSFQCTIASTTAGIHLFLPVAFCNVLVRASVPEITRRPGNEANGSLRLRERMLDCSFTASAELRSGSLTIGEMLAMKPGSVLNLRTPVQVPVHFGVGSYPLFQTTAVRSGTRKAAQLGPPVG